MTAAYLIAQISIDDRATYLEYQQGFFPIIADYDAELLVVDEAVDVLEGDWPHTRTVVLKFRDRAEARRWYDSPAYQELATIRHQAARSNVVLAASFDSALLAPNPD